MDDNFDYSINAGSKLEVPREKKTDGIRKFNSKHNLMDDKEDLLDGTKGVDVKNKLKRKTQETNENVSEKDVLISEDEKRYDIRRNYVKDRSEDSSDSSKDLDVEKKSRQEKQKIGTVSQKEVNVRQEVVSEVEKKLKKKTNVEKGEISAIDDPEASFVELFAADTAGNSKYDFEKKVNDNITGLVTFSVKKKKGKGHGSGLSLDLNPKVEIGMGGASTWGEE